MSDDFPGLFHFGQKSEDGKQIDFMYYPDVQKAADDHKIYLSYNGETDTLTIKAKKIVFETDEFTVDKPKA